MKAALRLTKHHPWRHSLPVAVLVLLVAGATFAAVFMTGGTPPPEAAPTGVSGARDAGPLPFGPVHLNETAMLVNITNHSGTVQRVTVSGGATERAWGLFQVKVQVFHSDGKSGEILFDAARFSMDDSFVSLSHDGSWYETPVGPTSVFHLADVGGFDLEWESVVSLYPGTHHLLVSARFVPVWFTVESFAPGEALTATVFRVDPEMIRTRVSSVRGHWDDVHSHVKTTYGGYVSAATEFEFRHDFRRAWLVGLGEYHELTLEDSAGTKCETAGIFPATSIPMVDFQDPPRGPLFVEGLTVSRGLAPGLFLWTWDLPIQHEWPMPGCRVLDPGFEPQTLALAGLPLT